MRQDASDQRTLPHLVDLVGDSGCGLEVPGDEGAVGGVSAHAVGTRDEVGAASQEQDVQGLLDVCLVHVHHLQAIPHKTHAKPDFVPLNVRAFHLFPPFTPVEQQARSFTVLPDSLRGATNEEEEEEEELET